MNYVDHMIRTADGYWIVVKQIGRTLTVRKPWEAGQTVMDISEVRDSYKLED